jgi:hypothetical protein
MFDAARSMSLSQLIEVAYYVRLALERRFRPEDLERAPIMAGLASEPGPEDQRLARDWIAEIQSREEKPVDQIKAERLEAYLRELSDLVAHRVQAEMKPDPVRGRQLLEELRRKVPVPAYST